MRKSSVISVINSESGQALLLAVFVGLLLLMCVPVIILVNAVAAKHGVKGAKSDKGTAIAEEGIAYAKRLLSSQGRAGWRQALAGNFPNDPNGPCSTSATNTDIIGADGGHFQLTCAQGAGCPLDPITALRCQPYEVYVKATAWIPSPNGVTANNRTDPVNLMIAARASEAYFSQQTVAATLPNGMTTAAGLQFTNFVPILQVQAGQTTGDIAVDWGPVISYASQPPQTFILPVSLDGTLSPRKFVTGAILGTIVPRGTGGAGPPITDHLEYWANTSLSVPPQIDLNAYNIQANLPVSNFPHFTSCTGTGGCTQAAGSGYINVPPGATAVLDGAAPGYSATIPTGVLYVDGGLNGAGGGNLELQNVQIDLHSQGAIIVTGKLTIGKRLDASGIGVINAPVPITAPREYALANPGWPCAGLQGTSNCMRADWGAAASTHPSVRGFVYVAGDMEVVVHNPPNAVINQSTIFGVLQVDGQLTVDVNAKLEVAYDDQVNHNILIPDGHFQLMTDILRDSAP